MFVLTGVDVPGNPATGIEAYLDLEKLSARVLTGLQEGQVLAGENVVEMLVRGHGSSLRLGQPFRKSRRRRAPPDRGIGSAEPNPPAQRSRAPPIVRSALGREGESEHLYLPADDEAARRAPNVAAALGVG